MRLSIDVGGLEIDEAADGETRARRSPARTRRTSPAGLDDARAERARRVPRAARRAVHRARVAEQVARACRRERVQGADGLARALRGDGEARRRFRRSVAISHAVAVPRSRAVRAARGRAAAAAGRGRRALERVVGGLRGRRRAALARDRARPHGRAGALAAARQRPARGEPRAGARGRVRRRAARADALGAARSGRRRPAAGRWRLVLCRNVAIYLEPAARRRVYATLVAALAARGCCCSGAASGCSTRPRSGCGRRSARLRAGGMRRRLTTRTVASRR